MKKKILFFIALISILACFFVISISAETPSDYIEFGARFEGSDEYITVYTINAEKPGNPRVDLNEKFYSDAEFTKEVDLTQATGLDFSVAKVHGSNTPTNRITPASNPFTKCTEVKWFKEGFTTFMTTKVFKGWTALKNFDFGCLTTIGDNCFENTGFVDLVIPATVTKFNNSAFYGCTSLQSVKFEGDLTSIGNSAFQECTSLVTVDFGGLTKTGKLMFSKTGLTSVVIPATISSLGNETFANCKSLTSVVFEEGFAGTLGSSAFMGTSALTTLTLVEGITNIPSQCFWSAGTTNGIEKVTLPDSVKSLASRAFSGSGIKALEIRETSQLESITGDAFAGMKSLKSIYLPTGVVISSDNVFQYCHNLERVENFENVVFNISSYGENVFVGKIFYECQKLKEIKIPNSVTAIVGTAWRYFALERIYIPASVASINKGWLDDLSHMPKTVVILYCGGDAQKLLSLTVDGDGNASTRLSDIIQSGNVVEYSGLDTEYETGCIVNYANTCDIYYNGEHMENDNLVYAYAGAKYLSVLKVTCPCGRNCGVASTVAEIQPMFVSQGYSATQYGSAGVLFGVAVNNEAIAQYKALTENDITFGLFAGTELNLGTNDAVNQNGEKQNNAISVDYTNRMFNIIEIKITGFSTDEQKEIKIAMGAYVIEKDDEGVTVSYIQGAMADEGQKYNFVSFNSIMGPF